MSQTLAPQPNGSEMIAQERDRQVRVEGWTTEHDDQHANDSLAIAGACYALRAYHAGNPSEVCGIPKEWPWEPQYWKPASRIRMLVKAGALIAAEIDRLLRLEAS
jgi:hypothetical protein